MKQIFNPKITVSSPFPRAELPSLFCWQERIRASAIDDSRPNELEAFMDWSRIMNDEWDRIGFQTWAASKDGEIGGYVEARIPTEQVSSEVVGELRYHAQMEMIFKREMYGLNCTVPALNLVLRDLFSDTTDAVFFPTLAHNKFLPEIFNAVGARPMGAISPRMQNGNPVDTEMWVITATQWEKDNKEWLERFEGVLDASNDRSNSNLQTRV